MRDPIPIKPFVSLLTPPIPSGIAVLAFGGPGAGKILRRLFYHPSQERKKLPVGGQAAYGHLIHAGQLLDEVLILGGGQEETIYEICCHGGYAAVDAVLSVLTEHGAQSCSWTCLVPPRTLEADLLAGLLQCEGQKQAALLAYLHSGAAHQTWISLKDHLAALAVGLASGTSPNLGKLQGFLNSYSVGRFLLRPPRVVLTGPANAGKSTLFNALAGENRALTSKIPGTTRDPVETRILLSGFPVRLIDLPGDEEPGPSRLLQQALSEGRRQIRDADLILRLTLSTYECPSERMGLNRELGLTCPQILLVNKTDLCKEPVRSQWRQWDERVGEHGAALSALKGWGIQELREKISQRLGLETLGQVFQPMVINKRQKAMLQRLILALENKRSDSRLQLKLESYLQRSSLFKQNRF